MIQTKKILKNFICYALVFICVFLYSQKDVKIYEDNNTIESDYISETTETPEVLVDEIDEIEETEIIENNYKPKIIYLLNELDDEENLPEPVRYSKQKHIKEILISAVGDFTLASNYSKPYGGSFYEYYDLYGPEYFCENIRSAFEDSDCVIANLECILSDNKNLVRRTSQQYGYKGRAEFTSIIKASNIDVVNLANNHTYDYSDEGYNDTINILNGEKIDYYGNETVLIKSINGIKVGFVGTVGEYRLAAVKSGLDYLTENEVLIKIVTFHWGNMDERVANATQIAAAHYAIDNGADLVIGHHPHVLQAIEIYKGKYIAYSIGNFIFDGNVISDIENRTSVIFQQKFVLYDSEIIDSSINLIPILTISNMSKNNFKPMFAEGEQKENILNKIEARSAKHR